MNKCYFQTVFTISVVSLSTSLMVYLYSMTYVPYIIKIKTQTVNFTGQNEMRCISLNDTERAANSGTTVTAQDARVTTRQQHLLEDDFNIQKTPKTTVRNSSSDHPSDDRHLQNSSLLENSERNRKFGRKMIVMYHFFHKMLKQQPKKVSMSQCHTYTNCDLVYQETFTTSAIDAAAVVFQGNHMPKRLPVRAFPDQAFVFLNIESPNYLQVTNLGSIRFNNFYNWTMTYRRDSDIPYLYGSVIPKYMNKNKLLKRIETGELLDFKNFTNETFHSNPKTNIYKNYTDIFYQKTKEIMWFNSHCDTASKRELYVKYLERHVTVDIFGRCSSRNNICPKNVKGCLNNVLKTYKFFLAFENSICNDYITEKVYNWFSKDIVVVVRGARQYKEYLPQGTYIDSADFESPRHLAEYLTYLGSNEQEYINILKRKDHFTTVTGDEFVQVAYCNLCYKLNNVDKFKRIAKPQQTWWTKGTCAKPKDFFPYDMDPTLEK